MNNSTENQKNSNKILFRNSPGTQKNNNICKITETRTNPWYIFFCRDLSYLIKKNSRKCSRTQLDLLKSMTQRLKNEDFNKTSFNKINFN